MIFWPHFVYFVRDRNFGGSFALCITDIVESHVGLVVRKAIVLNSAGGYIVLVSPSPGGHSIVVVELVAAAPGAPLEGKGVPGRVGVASGLATHPPSTIIVGISVATSRTYSLEGKGVPGRVGVASGLATHPPSTIIVGISVATSRTPRSMKLQSFSYP